MAHSSQEFAGRNKSFNDVDLLVLLHLMMRNVKGVVDDPQVEQRLTSEWREVFEIYGPGLITLGLDELAENETMKQAYLRVLRATEEHLDTIGPVYPKAQLQTGWRVPHIRLTDYPTDDLRAVIRGLRELLGS